MIDIIPIFFVNKINSSCMLRREWYNDSVSSGGGMVDTTDLKSVIARCTSSSLVWRTWKEVRQKRNLRLVVKETFYVKWELGSG